MIISQMQAGRARRNVEFNRLMMGIQAEQERIVADWFGVPVYIVNRASR